MLIKKPKNFNFISTVYSHGWYELDPFLLNEDKFELATVFSQVGSQTPVYVTIRETEKNLKVEFSHAKPNQKNKKEIAGIVRHVLRLDDDMGEFYGLIEDENEFAWIAENRAGRLMRSQTVFEDLIKSICTTNCSWALTKNMVSNLVEKLGKETLGGEKAFPTPEAMAGANEDFYRDKVRAGYRSPYFAEVAREVADEKIDPEEWLLGDLPTDQLKKEIKKVKGVGDYAAENLLKLVGRYDGLALDSWLRSEFYKKHNGGNSCSDKNINKFYSRFGDWKGLVIWFDMAKRFLQNDRETDPD